MVNYLVCKCGSKKILQNSKPNANILSKIVTQIRTITSDIYCRNLANLNQELKDLWQKVASRKGSVLRPCSNKTMPYNMCLWIPNNVIWAWLQFLFQSTIFSWYCATRLLFAFVSSEIDSSENIYRFRWHQNPSKELFLFKTSKILRWWNIYVSK